MTTPDPQHDPEIRAKRRESALRWLHTDMRVDSPRVVGQATKAWLYQWEWAVPTSMRVCCGDT